MGKNAQRLPYLPRTELIDFQSEILECVVWSIPLSKILPHSKTIKNGKKLLVFGENDSRRLSNFLQTHIFWKFDHISRTYNQINYRNIWFVKVTIILIIMSQVLFFHIFFKKDLHFNAVWLPCAIFVRYYYPLFSNGIKESQFCWVYLMVVKLLPVVWKQTRDKTWNKDSLKM